MAEPPENSVHALTRDDWRRWLLDHHSRAAGVWFVSFKKATGKPRVEYDDSVEEALCFGWVDSKVNALDHERSMLWFAPRRPRTGWSRSNKERVARLTAEGRMTPAGLAKVEAARRDGSWSRLDDVEDLRLPPDLEVALGKQPHARRHFEAFPRSVRRGILEWIVQAKRPETRARRVAETARLAALNQRANQWRKP